MADKLYGYWEVGGGVPGRKDDFYLGEDPLELVESVLTRVVNRLREHCNPETRPSGCAYLEDDAKARLYAQTLVTEPSAQMLLQSIIDKNDGVIFCRVLPDRLKRCVAGDGFVNFALGFSYPRTNELAKADWLVAMHANGGCKLVRPCVGLWPKELNILGVPKKKAG